MLVVDLLGNLLHGQGKPLGGFAEASLGHGSFVNTKTHGPLLAVVVEIRTHSSVTARYV